MSDHWIAAFLPLLDCAVLVAAREKGFLAAQGVELELVKEPSWASLRDHLALGHVDCAHALAPLPIAAALGVGQPALELAAPFALGRGGNAVTLSCRLHADVVAAADGTAPDGAVGWGRALARALAGRAEPPTFGIVHAFSNHNFDLRYWLAAAGVDPDRDVRLVAIPPPLMVDSLRAGQVDGFCVGEPWNSLAVAEDLGRIVVTKSELFPRGLEKVLAVHARALADRRLAPLLRGLASAAEWCDTGANHAELAALLAAPAYLGVDAALLEAALAGRPALGDGTTLSDPDFIYFSRHHANPPRPDEARWLYAQMVRWGQAGFDPACAAAAARVFNDAAYCDTVARPLPERAALPRAFDGRPAAIDDVAAYLHEIASPTAG